MVGVVDSDGVILQRLRYDAWGQRINPDNSEILAQLTLTSPLHTRFTPRGYTGHEMLDAHGLIHMNGRIYDPKLGRFLQADPVIQFPHYTQGQNRYSYVLNNPLTYTDPSGYFIGKLFKGLNKVFGDFAPFLSIALLAIPGVQAWVFQSWLSAFQFGFVTGGIATGSVKGALFGGISAAAFYGIGEHFTALTGLPAGGAGHVLTHGLAGGVLAELQGGQFGNGFLAAGLSKAVMGRFSYRDLSAPAVIGRTTIAAVVGGTVSRITGGKFANGALTAAMAQLFNNEASNIRARKKFVNPTDQGVRGCDSQGCGGYGARREGRRHIGTDYITDPGQDVLAIADGKVDRLLSGKYDGVVVGDGQGVSYKILYLNVDDSLQVGSTVRAGQVLGTAQDITGRYEGITNHVHVKLRVNYKVVNPEDHIDIP